MRLQTWPLTKTGLRVTETRGDYRRFLELAAPFDQSALLFAESPREVRFDPWNGLDEDFALACESVILFSEKAELRWQKTFMESEGWLRLVEDDAGGDEYWLRESSCVLRREYGGSLRCGEYFQADEQGFLTPRLGRILGANNSSGRDADGDQNTRR